MSDTQKPKGIKEGPPIWVESLMNAKEYKEAHKLYPNTVLKSEPPSFDADFYKGGKWRNK